MDVRDQYAYLRPQRGVWLFILGSTAVHAGLVALLIVGGFLKDLGAKTRDRARITALLRKGKPRPKDWLPRKPRPLPEAPPRTARPDPKVKPEPGRKVARHASYKKEIDQALKSLADEEAEGSPDGVDEGDALVAQKGNEYMTAVYKAVKGQYTVPEIISQRERMFLSATVVITINARGQIKDFDFEKHSGNSVYDSAIEAAIRRAAPFPPPPPELVDRYASEGIGLEFDARSM
jgi:protein TonB